MDTRGLKGKRRTQGTQEDRGDKRGCKETLGKQGTQVATREHRGQKRTQKNTRRHRGFKRKQGTQGEKEDTGDTRTGNTRDTREKG